MEAAAGGLGGDASGGDAFEDLERELEAQLDADLFEPPASLEAAGSPPKPEPVAVEAAASAATAAASAAVHFPPSASSQLHSEEFDLERALESQLDKASQGSEGNFDLENALASQLDKDPELLAVGARASEPPSGGEAVPSLGDSCRACRAEG